METIGVLYHAGRKASSQLADQVCGLLGDYPCRVWRGTVDDDHALREAGHDLDLLITFGGDGTIVRAVRAVSRHNVPILGVNLGRLGFLAEVEPERIGEALPALMGGDYTIEERMMLSVSLQRAGRLVLATQSINDVVMARGLVSRTVRIAVEVDGRPVMTPTSDGVIVSTPTGSTAYCLAAGGPIVAPDLNCIAITPIAAHLGIAHAWVIPAHRALRLRLIKGEDAMLTVDGQLDATLQPGDEVITTQAEQRAKFVRFGGDGYFYETVLRRLGWPDRGPTH